ncbi:MAG TPA: RNA polymerase subunit sigma-70 [Porphyromonadaceae bacterium]|jgi:RNA polymerase sigma factor (sigma-70 family)|nr:RNA polymerase subunit sigma-70 [Porphyromonadaceae bacterium]HBL33692.1 RNA polymerase subunit sigma-70 [Porphyromonadaceae bacterium]HBX19671.1 RNA polymerase subunit sigma-70 [Porphyromonadaceae bacterium]HCM20927.1 RNA polymerase subunit sigma-70 [Porphyromonadaceae bacterium]
MSVINSTWQQFLENGDETTFSVLYNCYVEDMYSYGISLGFQKEICKDAVQDVFYKLYISRKELCHITNGAAYIFKSYKHRLIDIAHKNIKNEPVPIPDSFITDITVLDNLIDTEKAIILKKKVEELLGNLTPRQREAVYLRYMMELEYEEISEILNISPESVRKLVYRSMEKLREYATKECISPLIWIILFTFRQ